MIRKMLTDPQLSDAVLNLLSTMTAEYRTPFDFGSPAEYQQMDRQVVNYLQTSLTTVE